MGVGASNEGFCVFGRKDEEGLLRESLFEDIALIQHIPLFAFLGKDELPRLAAAFHTERFEAGELVVKQGEEGDRFFIVRCGKARASVQSSPETDPEHVAMFISGDYFGEEVLVGSRPRSATVEAIITLDVWVLTRSDFERLDLRRKLHFKKRDAIAEGDIEFDALDVEPTMLEKSPQVHAQLKEALLKNNNLRPFLSHLSPEEISDIVDSAFAVTFKEGEIVCSQGELRADVFYLIGEGAVDVVVFGRTVTRMGAGSSFGELALLYRSPREATVKAATACTLWAVPRKQFRQIGREQLRQKLAFFTQLLGRVDIFKDLSNEDRQFLADALVETTFYKGELIIQQGERADAFFILNEGEVSVDIDGKEVSRMTAVPGQTAEFFGERALLTDKPRAASVRVESAKVQVLALDRHTFETVLRRNDTNLQFKFARVLSAMERVTYSLGNLETVGLLGTGAFGAVSLVRDRATQQTFALKAISKGLIIQMQQVKAVKQEKRVMQCIMSPFLVRLAATFNTDQHLYFLMECALGGELYTVYRRQNLFGSTKHAQFYFAGCLRGLEHLHERHVIYRDLKAENILLDSQGFSKMTDFGMAKFTTGHTYTLCGTPEYMSPEVVAGTGYTCATDWWSLGIFAYECMVGETPFRADDCVAIFHKVQLGIQGAVFPSGADHRDWPDLVVELCRQQPSERLPIRKGGVRNVMGHDWFTKSSFDWEAHRRRSMTVPYHPEVQGVEDLNQFDASEQDGPQEVHYSDVGTGWDEDFEESRGPRFYN